MPSDVDTMNVVYPFTTDQTDQIVSLQVTMRHAPKMGMCLVSLDNNVPSKKFRRCNLTSWSDHRWHCSYLHEVSINDTLDLSCWNLATGQSILHGRGPKHPKTPRCENATFEIKFQSHKPNLLNQSKNLTYPCQSQV